MSSGDQVSRQQFHHPPYQPGDVIVQSMPLIYSVFPESTESVCCGCFFSSEDLHTLPFLKELKCNRKLLKCGRCGKVAYCGRECQKFDWFNFHKFECNTLAQHGREEMFQRMYIRFYLRCLILMQNRPEELKKKYQLPDGSERCFMDLVDRREAFQADTKRLDEMKRTLQFFKGIGLDFDEEEFLLVLFKLRLNSLLIPTLIIDETVGLGLYIELCIFEHSCDSNCAIVFDGLKLQVRAMKNIPADGPLVRCYCNPLLPKNFRQAVLKFAFYFDCSCERCSKSDETDELWQKIDSLVNSYRDEVALVAGGSEAKYCPWEELARMQGQLGRLYEQIYGRYYPTLSLHKHDHLSLCLRTVKKLKLTFEDVLEDLKVTHGPDHSFTKQFTLVKQSYEGMSRAEIRRLMYRGRPTFKFKFW